MHQILPACLWAANGILFRLGKDCCTSLYLMSYRRHDVIAPKQGLPRRGSMAQRISEQFQGLVFLALSIIANFFICEPMRCHINLGRVTVTADIVQNLRCHCSGGALAAHQLRTQAGHKMPSLALKSVTLKRLLFKVTLLGPKMAQRRPDMTPRLPKMAPRCPARH
jgi:hypothetical protein